MKITLGTLTLDNGDGSYREMYFATEELAEQFESLLLDYEDGTVPCDAVSSLTIEILENGTIKLDGEDLPTTLHEAWAVYNPFDPFPTGSLDEDED